MFRKILVAIDGSQSSREAVDIAVDLAKRYRGSVCILHAYPHVSDLLGTPEYERLVAQRTLAGQELLDAAVAWVGDQVPVETQLLEGPAASAIVRVAETEGYDLIVLGARGRHHFAGVLLGSVSSTVMQRAPCPVLIAHAPTPVGQPIAA